MEVVPGHGGTFVVEVDGRSVFSKKETHRHLEEGEIVRLVSAALAG